ncbi:MAG: UDP-N-acetylmuramoyl-tripeptide--D-alanyl-D-alanine ligase [Candidatus Omnitrophica bacterium]|nr:UDP-N-acetylmuramoyl-tripeptide--D-alanyl-D-alanine ligase [Candidatus Omnitrophota bacterium]MCM8809483.1 UDP-N-acetylmuramoyl-tripeptide--D-alanyl-D-alanine ligase [Candidatus Omnitrophota bacterium]MCM8810354.1 UDP-N-acetylmuramoyl-tripeptide--D-alanyl-D-alanine ligase [Candidatus Omnitrophota bacterium]
MEKVRLSQIIQWCKGKVNKKFKDFFIEGISTDSRQIKKGEIFIALKGEKYDGHNFLEEAFKKGAFAAIVSENYKGNSGLLIRVKEPLYALGEICKNYRIKLNMQVIAITGSDGKTTTKEIVKNILSERFNTIGTIGNFNNQIGLPLSIFQANKKTEFGVFEIGMNKKGEIDYLSKICLPDACIITNIGVAHIGFFKSRKEIAEAKAEVFKNLINEKEVFLNRDDDFFDYLNKKANRNNIVSIGVKKKADINGKIIEEGLDFFIFESSGEKYKMNFWNPSVIYSGLFGISIGEKFGINKKYIKDVLSEIKPLSGRGEFIKNKIFIIDESYNSNPYSLKNSLLSFERKKFKRKLVVLGDMAELGRFSGFYHWHIGNLIKNFKIDIIFTFGEKSKIISEISQRGKHFYEIEKLKKELKNKVKKDDAIFIKGSRINKLELIVDFLKKSFI